MTPLTRVNEVANRLGATFLAVVSDTPKSFVVLFLLLLYVSVNDKGATARLDYAGMNRNVNPGVIAGYAIASVLLSRRSVAA